MILMHLLKPGNCTRKRSSLTRISDKIQSMLLAHLRPQKAVKKASSTWEWRKQQTDLGSTETHTPKEKTGGKSNAEDPPAPLKQGLMCLFHGGMGEEWETEDKVIELLLIPHFPIILRYIWPISIQLPDITVFARVMRFKNVKVYI